MSEKDFDLDIKITSLEKNNDVNITSKIACTEGCVTGIKYTCPITYSFTCACVIPN